MTHQPDPVDWARKAIASLADAVDSLKECLLDGVKRPWKTPALTAERRNELDREARAERLERDAFAPGECSVPLDLDVMDQLVEILAAAEILANRLCWATYRPIDPPASSAFSDPAPILELIYDLLGEAAGSLVDPGAVTYVEQKAKDLIEAAHLVLGLVVDGQVLKALCPWCGGRTESTPIGGELTLRVRNVEGLASTVVMCEGGLCEPTSADCGRWIKGKPAWDQSEWEWLAARISHHEQDQTA